jgi:hypothetical protein
VSVKLIKNFLHGIGSVSSHGLGEWRELKDRQHAVAVLVQVDTETPLAASPCWSCHQHRRIRATCAAEEWKVEKERKGREVERKEEEEEAAYTTSPLPFTPSNWKAIDVIGFPNKIR